MLLAGPFVAIWGMGAFFWDKFDEKKGHFVCLHPINRCHVIFIILNENIFFKTQGSRLAVIVTPNKVLEYVLVGIETLVPTFQKSYLYFQFCVPTKSILLRIIDSGLFYTFDL